MSSLPFSIFLRSNCGFLLVTTARFKQLKETRDDIQCLTEEDAIGFLSFANQKYLREGSKRWIYVVYLLALNAGPRAGEIWGLKPRDIIENGELIHIQRQFDILKRIFRPTKGKENRRIPCNRELFEELKDLIRQKKIAADETIFQASNGNPVGHDNFVFRMFKPDLLEWGRRSIRFHDLRHTARIFSLSPKNESPPLKAPPELQAGLQQNPQSALDCYSKHSHLKLVHSV